MALLGGAVIELDSHPDPNKGPDHRLSKDPSHRSEILAILTSRLQTLSLHDLCLEVLILHGNELRLFGTKAFPPTRNINVTYLT